MSSPILSQELLTETLAAATYERFGRDFDATIEAWKRMLQNDGWDDAVGRTEFRRLIERGQAFLRSCGFYRRAQ